MNIAAIPGAGSRLREEWQVFITLNIAAIPSADSLRGNDEEERMPSETRLPLFASPLGGNISEWGSLSKKPFWPGWVFSSSFRMRRRRTADDVVAVLDDSFGIVSHNGLWFRRGRQRQWQLGHLMPADAPADDGGSFLSPCRATWYSAVPRRMGWTATMSPRAGCGQYRADGDVRLRRRRCRFVTSSKST